MSRASDGYRLAGAVLALPILLWFAGWLLFGDDLLLVRWGAYVAPWLALLAAFAAGLFAAARRRLWSGLALLLALMILAPVLPRLNPERWFNRAPAGDLRVMTFNMSTLNTDFTAVARLIAHERPDIVFLQQVPDIHALQTALQRLPQSLAYSSVPEKTADTIILSRFALSRPLQFSQRTGAVATVHGCPIRLWSLHAPHGQQSPEEQQLYFLEAADAIGREPLPVIAGGDLNSTEFNSVQSPLRDVVQDAFSSAGVGFGFTFPSRVRRFGMLGRLFRIDHIFSKGLTVTSAWTVTDSANSDHFPVMAIFSRPSCAVGLLLRSGRQGNGQEAPHRVDGSALDEHDDGLFAIQRGALNG